MNNHPNADKYIKAELTKILSFNRNLPAFKRGKMYMNFSTGKICVEQVS